MHLEVKDLANSYGVQKFISNISSSRANKLSLSHSATLKKKKKGWLEAVHANTPFLAAFGLALSISVPTLSGFVLTFNRA